MYLSVNQAADEFGRDRGTLARKLSEFGVKPAAERNGYSLYRLRDLIDMERRGADGEIDPNKLNPMARLAHFKAETERLKVNRERGNLIERGSYEEELARVLKVVSLDLDTITDEVERDVGASPLVLEKIEQKIDTIRERIFSRIVVQTTEET